MVAETTHGRGRHDIQQSDQDHSGNRMSKSVHTRNATKLCCYDNRKKNTHKVTEEEKYLYHMGNSSKPLIIINSY